MPPRAALPRLRELRRLPRRRRRRLGGLRPRPRLDRADPGQRARRLRRRAASTARASSPASPAGATPMSSRPRTATAQRRSFDVIGVAGIHPLQQYLLSPDPGRTQAFDIAWDTERRRWYDLYPDQVAAARRRPALDRPLQELGGALRRVPRHRLQPQLRHRHPQLRARDGRDRASAARPATAPARRTPPGPPPPAPTTPPPGRG